MTKKEDDLFDKIVTEAQIFEIKMVELVEDTLGFDTDTAADFVRDAIKSS